MKAAVGILITISLSALSCSREKETTLNDVFKKYQNGKISECQYNGKLIYVGQLNAYDAGSKVYDNKGNEIGTCNYAWGNIDPVCGQKKNCEVIYCIKDNIWGEKEVNKYGL
ncbi:hypothetical protein [Salibacter halophilus]|uniref:Uncharacterized protein n=1 Tax=Salibacter halophilus TaxID=1803916 RepID=A0A6N6M6N3_9FLAO|nr:hypothetical protein [Salibacter halophilus]KAB1065572.1 hypothetical protein F3059_02660 [Salibacter halophilus]